MNPAFPKPTGAQLIAEARLRQLSVASKKSTIAILAEHGARVAQAIDELISREIASNESLGDLFEPRIEFVGADGSVLSSDEGAVAFVLPQYGRMFDINSPKAKNWDDAVRIGKTCRTLGYDDWQLSSDQEMSLLIGRAYSKPATYPQLAKHTRFDDWYWTRTTDASSSGYAWGVGMSHGLVGIGNRTGPGFARACRLVPPRQ